MRFQKDEKRHTDRKLWIGTSGWVYPHWRGVFYPQGLATTRWLAYYVEHFPTVELNNTFYRFPTEKALQGWRDNAPQGFCYAVKVNRYLTHLKKLQGIEKSLERFLDALRLLGDKLGPLLHQLPPYWGCNVSRLRAYLSLLPGDLRHVFEFREPSWLNDEVFDLLAAEGMAVCLVSMPQFPCPERLTAPFVYMRMHGSQAMYVSCYSEEELQGWAQRIRGFLESGRDVYIYFNNDAYGYAVQNARRLREILE